MAHPADKYANATLPWMRYQPRRDTLTAQRPTMAERIPIAVKAGLRKVGLNKFAANAFGSPIADVLGYSPVGAAANSWDIGAAAAGADTVTGKALGLGLGGLDAMLNAVPGGPAAHAMFLGIGAKLGDKAGMAAVRRAAQMKAAGIPREQILKETGFFQGADKKWRFEVDDSAAKFPKTYPEVSLKRGVAAADLIKHPELFAADKTLSTVPVKVDYGNLRGYQAAYNPAADEVSLEASFMNAKPKEVGSSLLHELQHAAQGRHGFAKGGNMTEGVADELNALHARKMELYDAGATKPADAWYNGPNGWKANKRYTDVPPEILEANPSLAEYHAILDREAVLDAQGRKNYKRLAGEVEARNVQTRMGMSAQERVDTPPWATQDVPDLEQIIRRHVNGAGFAGY